jgi:hypothetical protein
MPIVDCHVTLEGNLVPTVSQNASQLADLLAVRGIERAIVTSARAARVDPLSGNHLLKSLIEPHPGLFACLTMHVNRVDASIQAARELLGGRRFVSVMLTSTDPSAAAQQAANISLEMSGSLDRAKVPAAIEALGSHRLLFGSGLPALDPVAALGLLDDGDVRPNDRRRILVDNAEKVFGLPALTI